MGLYNQPTQTGELVAVILRSVLSLNIVRAVLCPVVSVAIFLSGDARAADPRLPATVKATDVPASYRIESNHYVTAREAADVVAKLPNVLLIDVRTYAETLFNGIATPMHRHIPYVMLDVDHSYDAGNQRYKLEPNPDFVKAVDNLLAEHKLNRGATLILYCSVGERSARAANLLGGSGFANVYSMVDGFEGDATSKAGPGWKTAGLPWSHRMAPSQAYKSPSM